jgi:hypothetical protein
MNAQEKAKHLDRNLMKLESYEFLALHEALNRLVAFDPLKARIVELRYFGGLTVEETSEVLKISTATVMRDWRLARVWLRREIQSVESLFEDSRATSKGTEATPTPNLPFEESGATSKETEAKSAIPSPPFNAEYLLYLLLRKEEREILIGDLTEEYGEVNNRFNKHRADTWFYKQVFGSVWPLLRRALLKIGALVWLGRILRRLVS